MKKIILQNIKRDNGTRLLREPPDPDFPMHKIGDGSLLELTEDEWKRYRTIQLKWDGLQTILRTCGVYLDGKDKKNEKAS